MWQEDDEEDVSSYWKRTEKTGYWKLKEEALDGSLWRAGFAKGYGPVIRQTAELIN